MSSAPVVEGLLRSLTPQVLGALVRRFGHFDLAEDAVQEASLAAATRWPTTGVPDDPRAWLITVAARRLTDQLRSSESRRRREELVAAQRSDGGATAPADAEGASAAHDDTLLLLFLCCHPSLTTSSQIALTLRAVGGLTTAEIARAFLVPEATMRRRIHRAKERVQAAGGRFAPPTPEEQDARIGAVLHVLYLVFNEGYTASSGTDAQRRELAGEAIRLARTLHQLRPEEGEIAGLLALLLLTDARRDARTDADGALVPLLEQDRRRWDHAAIAQGIDLVTRSLATGPVGPYGLQAAIAAVHAEAAQPEDTDWAQILGLYDVLRRVAAGPVVELNRAVAVAMVHGAPAGLELLDALADDPALARGHRLEAVRAHLLELAGDHRSAAAHYRTAAQRTGNVAEQRFLTARATRLAAADEVR